MSVFDLISAGDEDGLRELLERSPEAAAERDPSGLSPVLHALFLGRDDLAGVLLDANPALDVFDAAATGRTRGLAELLDAEPELARARRPDGTTAFDLALRFEQEDAAELLRERGAGAAGEHDVQDSG